MDEMVERAARAICESQGLDWNAQASAMTSGSGSDDEQEAYRLMARAAIEAMHEPTDEMLGYGERVLDETGSIRDAYVAMTHAAYSREFPY